MNNDEFVPEWDVHRDRDGNAVTITEEQSQAIWRAISVWMRVAQQHNPRQYGYLKEGPPRLADMEKSRLLGRMLFDGKPPTRTVPPKSWGGPDWSLLPGGDPFADPWTDFDWALFLLDGAEQSIVEDFHAKPHPRAMELLSKYQKRRDQLRREYAVREQANKPKAVSTARERIELIADLADPEPCSFDHHGYCQAHGWLIDERPCPHGRAQQLLSEEDK